MTVAGISDQHVTVPGAPDVPGLTFRRFRGEADYPGIVDILRACRAVDGLEMPISLEIIAHDYGTLINCDPYKDMIFAEIDGEPVGYGRVLWFPEANGDRVYLHTGWVVPAWRRKGIGTAILHWQEARLRAIASGHPAGGKRVYAVDAMGQQRDKCALFEREGYQPAAYIAEMVRSDLEDIPQAELPAGFDVRPVAPEHYRAIWDAEQEAFRDHFGWMDHSNDNVYEDWFLGHPYFDPGLWRVAWHGDEVAGMVRSFIDTRENATNNRLRGYTENISVRKPYRRRGLARALLVQSLHGLKERGMHEAALGVHTENVNNALGLYESVGFRMNRRIIAYRKPLD